MKTYVLEAIKRIKRFSEKFDISTTLCDKTWVVFNDTGERELYIFQPDGTTFITKNGVGIKGKWHWISANQSLIINKDDNVIMLHPEYIDKTILALNLDGTQKMAFLIEQGNKEAFAAKTLAQLEQYFENKEKLLIAEQNRKIEQEKQRYLEEEKRRKTEEERKRVEAEKKEEERRRIGKEANEKRYKKEAKKLYNELASIGYFFLGLLIGLILYVVSMSHLEELKINNVTVVLLIFGASILFPVIGNYLDRKRTEKRIRKWMEENPWDSKYEYMEEYIEKWMKKNPWWDPRKQHIDRFFEEFNSKHKNK